MAGGVATSSPDPRRLRHAPEKQTNTWPPLPRRKLLLLFFFIFTDAGRRNRGRSASGRQAGGGQEQAAAREATTPAVAGALGPRCLQVLVNNVPFKSSAHVDAVGLKPPVRAVIKL